MTRQETIRKLIDARERAKKAGAATSGDAIFMFAYWFGAPVLLKTDAEGATGLVTGILLTPGEPRYFVTWGDTRDESGHYGFELQPADDHPASA